MRQTWQRIWRQGIAAMLGIAGGLVGGPGTAEPLTPSLTVPTAQAQASEAWSERAPMLLPRSEASVAELNGRIYFIGGYPGTRLTSDSVQIYDPKTDSWELGPPLPLPLHHTMASVVSGQLYVIGGEAGNPTASESVFQPGLYILDQQADACLLYTSDAADE